jgi:ABC-2 type transport system ATP-binding protein
MLVKLSNIYKSFGKHEVLKDVTLTLEPGTITGLLGPSGGGKTTLVNVIIGMYKASAGQVEVLEEHPPYRKARMNIGYMPQSEALYDDLTADQNLRFFGSLYGMSRKDLDAAIPRMLDIVKLEDTGKKTVLHFSGGMKRRLSLAIALLHSPRLLVLDEPTIGLDPEHRVLLWKGFRELAAAGSCLLITTHVMDEAENCDEVLMLREGSIIARGTPGQLVKNSGTDNLEAAFLSFGNIFEQREEVSSHA